MLGGISTSPLLQALGFAILNSVWQLATLWLLYIILSGLFKPKALIRFRMAVLFQTTGFVWFLFTLNYYYGYCLDAQAFALLSQTQQNEAAYHSNSFSYIFSYARFLLPYLSVAYLLLLFSLVIKWIRSFTYTIRIKSEGLVKIDVDWRLFTQRMSALLGIKPEVKIYLSEIVKGPVTVGFLKPIILIPVASINHLNIEQLEAVILHELAHIKRFDYVVNILLSLIEMVLFFNPFTHLFSKQINQNRELACDDWVMQFQYDGAMYAEALLKLATVQQAQLSMHAANNKKQDLLLRVRRVVGQSEQFFSYRQQVLALITMTLILGCMMWFNPLSISTAVSAQTKTQQTSSPKTRLAKKTEDLFFNPAYILQTTIWPDVTPTMNFDANEKLVRLPSDASIRNDENRLPVMTASLVNPEDPSAIYANGLQLMLDSLAVNKMNLVQANALLTQDKIAVYEQQVQRLAQQMNKQFATTIRLFKRDSIATELQRKASQIKALAATQEVNKTIEGFIKTNAAKLKLMEDSLKKMSYRFAASPVNSDGLQFMFMEDTDIPVPVYSFETKADVNIRNKTKAFIERKLSGDTISIEELEFIRNKKQNTDSTQKKRIIILL